MTFSDEKSKQFYNAARLGNLQLVQSLSVDPEVNLNWGNEHSSTPFNIACSMKHHQIVRYLLDFKARPIDYNISSNAGWTPVSVSCYKGNEKVIEILFSDARIEVDKADKEERTPLWWASNRGKVGVVKVILASGREVDTQKEDRNERISAAKIARSEGTRCWHYEGETRESFLERKKGFGLIADLLEAFEKDPVTVQAQLRSELGFDGMSFIKTPSGFARVQWLFLFPLSVLAGEVL